MVPAEATTEDPAPARVPDDDRGSPVDDPVWPRRVGWLAVLVVVLPVWVAVTRAGAAGLFPTGDAAETVMRARDVFDGPFPLVGMSAAGGSQTGYDVYFPGAWQLYVIAVPTRLFGVVWGPLVAMGILNTAWIVSAGWLLIRRLRPNEAVVGIMFLGLLSWSVGSGFLISPVPMDMVLIPTAALLVAAWATADGDPVAIPVLAVIANYLWLDHLVLVLTVPVIVACGLVGLVLWYRSRRRTAARSDSDPTRRVRRGAVAAGVITLVMWVPTIVQQLTVRPGNLGQLFTSVGTERPVTGSWWSAAHYTISVIARPPFWFRGSVDDPDFATSRTGLHLTSHLSLYDLVAWLVVFGLLAGLGVLAHRRGDRTGTWLTVVAGVAVMVTVVTTHSAPNYLSIGPPMGYIRGTWAVAMFVWLAIGVNLVRLLRGRFCWRTIVPALVVVLLCGVGNLPTASRGYGTDARTSRLVEHMNEVAVPALDGGGAVRLVATSFDAHVFSAALALEMSRAGVPFCFSEDWLLSDGSRPGCEDGSTPTLLVQVLPGGDHAVDGEAVFTGSFLDPDEVGELAELDRVVAGWLAGQDRLVLSPEAAAGFDDLLANVSEPAFVEPVRGVLDVRGDRLAGLVDDPALVTFVNGWYATRGSGDPPLFEDDPLTVDQWRRWVELRGHDRSLLIHRQ